MVIMALASPTRSTMRPRLLPMGMILPNTDCAALAATM